MKAIKFLAWGMLFKVLGGIFYLTALLFAVADNLILFGFFGILAALNALAGFTYQIVFMIKELWGKNVD